MKRRSQYRVLLALLSMFAVVSIFAPNRVYRLGMSRSLDAELARLEREIEDERALSCSILLTAEKLRRENLGNELSARGKAIRLLEDSQTAGNFAFLKTDDPVEDALQKLPEILKREDSLLKRAKQTNTGVGRFDAHRVIESLREIRDLHHRAERGYRAVLRAYNN